MIQFSLLERIEHLAVLAFFNIIIINIINKKFFFQEIIKHRQLKLT